jgi:pSer/pThr/pTyr-binding forkhead associated (FHA) protein
MTASDDKPSKPPITSKLQRSPTIIVPGAGSFGTRFKAQDVDFVPVPGGRPKPNVTPWRVVLKFGVPTPKAVLGLDIYDDVVLGRSSQGYSDPDIDLTELDALAVGVSRRHALLRPTPNKLFLIDLDSTNGTTVNAVPVGRGMAQAISGGDLVSLGGVNFLIEILQSPAAKTAAAQSAPAEAEAGSLNIVPTATPADKVSPAKLAVDSYPKHLLGGEETIPPGQMKAVTAKQAAEDAKAKQKAAEEQAGKQEKRSPASKKPAKKPDKG